MAVSVREEHIPGVERMSVPMSRGAGSCYADGDEKSLREALAPPGVRRIRSERRGTETVMQRAGFPAASPGFMNDVRGGSLVFDYGSKGTSTVSGQV